MEWMLKLLSLIALIFFPIWLGARSGFASDINNLTHWDLDPENQSSLTVEPVRETATTADGLRLGLKHFSKPGGEPILLIHGIGTNDRQWDITYPKKSNFARFLYALGYDVWIGNLRGFGTRGFRSEAPRSTKDWTIDHYAAFDIPAMVDLVYQTTGKPLWLISHSLGSYAVEGYLAGLQLRTRGHVLPQAEQGIMRQKNIRGLIFMAGVHNFWWPKSLSEAITNPVRTIADYYQSNYELQLLAGTKALYYLVPTSWSFPLSDIQYIANFPIDRIPIIGSAIKSLYNGVLNDVANNPFMNIFYHVSNTDKDTMRIYFEDGLENIPFTVIEQLGNAVHNHVTQSYYHHKSPQDLYSYGDVRKTVRVPELFIAGGHDRLSNAQMIYEDGYLASSSPDKSWLQIEDSGHEDLILGKNSMVEMMIPVAHWLSSHHSSL